MTEHPELSVVVCTHNGARTLGSTLRSLAAQSIPNERYELIVVDDGSTDDTAAVARAAGVRLVQLTPNAGLAAARNAGISVAAGSIVAFTDDDCEVAPDWAQMLLDGFSEPAVAGVGGVVVPASSDRFLERFLAANNPLVPLGADLLASNSLPYRLLLYVRRLLVDSQTPSLSLYSVVGANMAFRRDVLVALDGFDEAFRFGSEEEDLCLRLHQRFPHVDIRYAPGAVVTHWFRPGVRDSIRRSRSYGRGNARRVLKHPDTNLIIYPAPVLGVVCLLSAVVWRRSGLVCVAAALPLVAYPRWTRQAIRAGSAEPILYPYLSLAQDIAGMLGERDGLRAGYQPVPSSHLVVNDEVQR